MSNERLVEVWGDTVDTVHLGLAVVIGSVISLACYLIASRVLTAVVSPADVARAYAMLVGLAGCIISGIVCAKLFPPKREVVEAAADPFWREEVLAQLVAESKSIGAISDLPPETVQELKELGLYELFASHERMSVENVPHPEEVLRRELAHPSSSLTPPGH